MKNRKACMELSVGTLVLIVLAISLLVGSIYLFLNVIIPNIEATETENRQLCENNGLTLHVPELLFSQAQCVKLNGEIIVETYKIVESKDRKFLRRIE